MLSLFLTIVLLAIALLIGGAGGFALAIYLEARGYAPAWVPTWVQRCAKWLRTWARTRP